MKKQLVTTIILVLLPFLFVSCISNLLKEKAPTFSKEVKLTEPAKPFESQSTSVYPSWKNSKTGNVIAIVSDCEQSQVISLQQMHILLEDSLSENKVVIEVATSVQDKPAYYKVVTGLLDGYQIEIRSFSFKRKSCVYLSSLSGKKDNLEADMETFKQFNNSLSFE
jgi:hypothetical protein